MTRIGINGFGRIGRTLLRLISERTDMQVVHVNDVSNSDQLIHLFKFDSIHGKFKGEVFRNEIGFNVNGKSIRLTNHADTSEIGWDESLVDIVIEATGKFKDRESLNHHLKPKVQRVILSVPPLEEDIPMVVLGVNEDILSKQDKIISNASCTTNSAAPLVQIMKKYFKVDSCFITTVHSYTTDQNLQDAPHKDLRRARGAIQSIIPTTTGAAKALTRIFPDMEDVIGGCGIRVPVPDGSLTDLTFSIEHPPSVKELNTIIKKEAETNLDGIIEFNSFPLVSSDIIGRTHSCVFDSELTSVVGNMVKLVGWYDNEMGYSSRVVDLVNYLMNQE